MDEAGLSHVLALRVTHILIKEEEETLSYQTWQAGRLEKGELIEGLGLDGVGSEAAEHEILEQILQIGGHEVLLELSVPAALTKILHKESLGGLGLQVQSCRHIFGLG